MTVVQWRIRTGIRRRMTGTPSGTLLYCSSIWLWSSNITTEQQWAAVGQADLLTQCKHYTKPHKAISVFFRGRHTRGRTKHYTKPHKAISVFFRGRHTRGRTTHGTDDNIPDTYTYITAKFAFSTTRRAAAPSSHVTGGGQRTVAQCTTFFPFKIILLYFGQPSGVYALNSIPACLRHCYRQFQL